MRFSYVRDEFRDQPILGVPPHEIGRLQYEGWGLGERKFVQIDELVMTEAIRRGLNMENHHVNMMIYGYIDKSKWEDIRTPLPKGSRGFRGRRRRRRRCR